MLHASQISGEGLLQGGHWKFGQLLEERVDRHLLCRILCGVYKTMPVPRLVPGVCLHLFLSLFPILGLAYF